jgi:hypothetical protein
MQKAVIVTVKDRSYSCEVDALSSHFEAGWRVVSCTPFHCAASSGGKSEYDIEPDPAMLVILERTPT